MTSKDAVIVVRPARPADLDGLLDLAHSAGPGMTNLQPDRDALAERVLASEAALREERADSTLMFVLDADGPIMGTTAIFPRIGEPWPFFSYKRGRQVSVSSVLGIRREIEVLHPVNDLSGAAEAGGLLVLPALRGRGAGRLAARSRYMFLAEHRSLFPRMIIAELRGYQDEAGGSPVWDAIGRHFYHLPFPEADRLSGVHGAQFIAELGPKYPIYSDLLPQAARQALGKPHRDSQPAYDMLVAEGFLDIGYVDIFDGGPQVLCEIDQLKAVREGASAVVSAIEPPSPDAGQTLISSGRGLTFRAARGAAETCANGVRLEPALAAALALKVGDIVRHTRF